MPSRPIALTVTPEPDDPGCAMVTVTLDVQGVAAEFILDTGAPRTKVAADAPGLTISPGAETAGGVFGVGEEEVGTLSELLIGGVHLTDLPVAVGEAGGHDVLGMDVLGRDCLRLSYSTGELQFGAAPLAGGAEMLAVGERGHLLLTLTWDDVVARACFDTGAGITVLDTAFAAAHPGLFVPAGESTGTDSTGTTMVTPVMTMAGPRIGPCTFAPSPVALVDFAGINATAAEPIDLIIGYPLMSQADWILDVPAGRWSAELI